MFSPSILSRCVGRVLGQFREPLARFSGTTCRVEALEGRALMSASLDPSFDLDGLAFVDVFGDMDIGHAVAVQADGKTLVAGMAEMPVYARYGAIARFNPDGSPDLTFGTGGVFVMPPAVTSTGVTVEDFTSLVVGGDGKIILAGVAFVGWHPTASGMVGGTAFAAVRLNPDGTLDNTFGDGGVALADFCDFFDDAQRVALGPGGKVVVVGIANRFATGDQGDFGVARFNADGSPDLTFSGDGKAVVNFTYADYGGVDVVKAVAFGPGGTIVLGGLASNLTVAAGPPLRAFALARLTAGGALDASFGDGGLVTTLNGGFVGDLLVDADGGILACGAGQNSLILARYRADGSLDTAFGGATPAPPFQGDFRMYMLAGGEVAVASAGYSGAYAARFDANGVLVSSSSIPISELGANAHGHAAALSPDGRLVVVGIAYPAQPSLAPGSSYDAWHASANMFVARYELSDGLELAPAAPWPDVVMPEEPAPEEQPGANDPGPEAPGGKTITATLSGKDVVRGGRWYKFTVTYTCASGIGLGDLGDLTVTGPNGFSAVAQVTKVKPSNDGTRLVVRYVLEAPGGKFDLADNGVYLVLGEGVIVQAFADGDGVSAPNGGGTTLGGFRVKAKKHRRAAFAPARAVTSNGPTRTGEEDVAHGTNAADLLDAQR